ncbi:MAG TPA: restriction endonuclease [Bacteriovoracaceae bacterium]|nr:restriction endonuclease [Bacteriovoracaceae bacterium]
MNSKLYIYKSSGGIEPFSRKKLFQSLKRSGLSTEKCNRITNQIYREIKQGDNTKNIYEKALRLVNKESHYAAVQYSLKKAIFELGPAGHYFEKYVARYFNAIGFYTQIGVTLEGRWVNHEVDIVAVKDKEKFYVECKFHNKIGRKNDIKTALYVKSRWEDLKKGPEGKNLSGFYLVSNTAFSKDAIRYSEGTGLRLLGVNAPSDKPFLEEIKEMQLYPVTSLKRLTRSLKNYLLSKDVLLAEEVVTQIPILERFGMGEEEVEAVLLEIELLTRKR